MRTGARTLGVCVTDSQLQQLLEYLALVEKWNRSINLVSRQDVGRLASRHVLDSLSVNALLVGTSVLDIGTGAGFPGVPLAIVNTGRRFLLCDRMTKRIRFLRVVKSELHLTNVELLEQDFALATNATTEIDTILARAVAPSASLWPSLEPKLAAGGRILVLSSTQAPTQTSQASVDNTETPYRLRAHSVAIPGLAQPHWVEILERH